MSPPITSPGSWSRVAPRLARAVGAALLATVLAPTIGALAAQQSPPGTADVFRRNADRVVKIQVVETASAAKASIGSGFFVTDRGHIVTNYHVISDLIHAPERYRAEMVDAQGESHRVTVLGVDVVHDLALLSADLKPRAHFSLGTVAIAQGMRLYSLGHPHDLGLTIVEGTYNGLLSNTLHPRIHLTGSLNPGMSGGPTITDDGRVVGINVATSGDEISFLVPVERAAALVERTLASSTGSTAPTLEQVGRQIRDYQDVYLRDMFVGKTQMVDLGPFRVVTQPAAFFRCWADATRSEEHLYEEVNHSCSTDDYLFIAGDHSSGVVEVEHLLISTRQLGPTRFFALYSRIFDRDETPSGSEEHVTSWQCSTRNVKSTDVPMRAVLCLRRYRKLGELYDAVLKVAVLGRRDAGLVSTLTLSGVTFENVDKLSRRYLELISWR
jgi:S1-C subfamily serine protease